MNYKKLIISLTVPQFAGLLGSFFTSSAISVWYANLLKPSFNPPNWIFGPVWISLYILMGISVYLVWNSNNKKSKMALNLFWIHLVFNSSWSIIFFGLKNTGFAFLNIIILLIFIFVLILKFWKIDRLASYLLIPYILWVGFASVLNYFIWTLNALL